MATIKDVARLAGVGIGTASRAISGRGSVSPQALARVNAAVEKLEFRPSSIAQALSHRSLGAIGLVVHSFWSPCWASILSGADIEIREAGRHMVVAASNGEGSTRQRTLSAIECLIKRDCDGIVLIAQDLEDEDLLFMKKRVPRLVVVNRAFAPLADACFSVDHRAGGALAARALLEHGHRRFAVIEGPASAADNRDRVAGFKNELAGGGVEMDRIETVESDFTPGGGWHAAAQLWTRRSGFTGLFCANDEMAVGAMSYFRQAGISVPDDVSVVGYDDIDAAWRTAPMLSTVRIPWEAMTRNAVRWMINVCYGAEVRIERTFPVSLTIRESISYAPDQFASKG